MDKALLVGIDHYPWAPLHGCVHDVKQLAPMLACHSNGRRNYEVKQLISTDNENNQVTTDRLKKHISRLFENRSKRILFYFSGHGSDELGGTFVTQNGTENNPGLPFIHLFNHAHKALAEGKTQEVIVLLDCCFSGNFADLPFIGTENAIIQKGMSILASSQHNEYSREDTTGSVFTNYLTEALHGGVSDVMGRVTLANTYYYMDQALGAWDQRPIFKAHVDKMPILRQVTPQVAPDELRLITTYFPNPESHHLLSPAYPDTEHPRDEEKELIFTHLLNYQRAGLLRPSGAANMYPAAMNYKACQLTPLGKVYWRLVDLGEV